MPRRVARYWIADAEPYELQRGARRGARGARGRGTVGDEPVADAYPARASACSPRSVDRLLQASGRYVQAVHVLGELKDTIACDISAARKDLGYEPTVSLVEGMRASVRFCLERGWQL